MRPKTVLPVFALLAACHSQPAVHKQNASVVEVAEATKDAVKLQPGKWETTVAVLAIDGPGLPAGVAAAMKQRTQAQKVEVCLTPEDAAKPPQDMLGAAKNCTYDTFEMSAGKMNGTLVCKNAPGMPAGEMRASLSGSFAATSYDLTSEATMTMPALPGSAAGGKITTKTQIQGKRLGDCAVPKAS